MDRRQNRLHVWLLTAALAVSASALRAHAQIVDIPEPVRTNVGAVSEQDRAAIKAYIDANSKNLLNGEITNAENLRKDRDALLRKLQGNISASFRLAYAGELQPHIEKMLASGNVKIVINGLVLAGACATDNTLRMVTSKLTDKTPDTRFTAAVQLGTIFRSFAGNEQRAVNPGNITAATRSLEQLIANEENPNVRAELIRAGLAATAIASEKNAAIIAVAKGSAANLRKAKVAPPTDAELNALLRAVVGLRDEFANPGNQAGGVIVPDASRAVAELGGCVLNFTAKVVPGVANPQDLPNRARVAQLAGSAQTAIELAAQLLGRPTPLGVDLPRNLSQGNKNGDARFVVDVGTVTVALTKPPFELPAERFK